MFLALCAALGALFNRASGMDRFLPGRNIYYTSLGLSLLGSAFLSLEWGLALLASALAYRLPGWHDSIDMGTDAQSLERDALVMFGRGLYAFPAFAWALYRGSENALYFLVLGSLGATLAYVVGNWVLRPRLSSYHTLIELAAGASLGLAFGLAFLGAR